MTTYDFPIGDLADFAQCLDWDAPLISEGEAAAVAAAELRRWVNRTHDGRPTRGELRTLVGTVLDEHVRAADLARSRGDELARADRDLAHLRAECAAAMGAREKTDAENERLRREVDGLRRTVDLVRGQRDRALEERDGWLDEHAGVVEELKGVTAVIGERDELRRRLVKAHRERDATRQENARLRRDLDAARDASRARGEALIEHLIRDGEAARVECEHGIRVTVRNAVGGGDG